MSSRADQAGSVGVGRSALHGRGLFALTCLRGHRKLGELSGHLVKLPEAWKRVSDSRKIYMVQVSGRYALDCSHGNAFRFLNHSCDSNCYMRVIRKHVEIYTRRDIAAGVELTVDYGHTPHRGGMSCHCGAAKCRGVV